jgi:hypothetical protein
LVNIFSVLGFLWKIAKKYFLEMMQQELAAGAS